MLTLLQIDKAVTEKIKSVLAGTEFENIPFVEESGITENPVGAEEGSETRQTGPSIKTVFYNLKATKFNESCKERTVSMGIVFLAGNTGSTKETHSKMEQLLENALMEEIYSADTYLPVSNILMQAAELELKVTFEVYLLELLPNTKEEEPMENLLINQEEVND